MEAKRVWCKVVGLFTALIFAGGLMVSQSALAKTYRMKIQSAYPRGDLSMELLKVFADSAKKHSNGQIRIQVFAEPEIVPGDQLLGAAKQGVLDMVHAMGGYWSGIMPIGNVPSVLEHGILSYERAAKLSKADLNNLIAYLKTL